MNNANRSGGKMIRRTKNKQRGCGKALGGGRLSEQKGQNQNTSKLFQIYP